MSVDPFGDVYEPSVRTSSLSVAVVGWIADRARVEQVLDGVAGGHGHRPQCLVAVRAPAPAVGAPPATGLSRSGRSVPVASSRTNIGENRNEFYSEEGP